MDIIESIEIDHQLAGILNDEANGPSNALKIPRTNNVLVNIFCGCVSEYLATISHTAR